MAKKRKKRKLSDTRQEYMKQRRRLSSMVSRLRKKGQNITLNDIAGPIPTRITKKAVQNLAKIKTQEQAIKAIKRRDIKAPTPVPIGGKIPNSDAIALRILFENFSTHHEKVQKAIHKYLKYIIDEVGESELVDALDDLDYEGIYLPDYGGYLIEPSELSKYLQQLTHFISYKELDDLKNMLQKVNDIIAQYEEEVSEAEAREWGSWRKGRRRKRR